MPLFSIQVMKLDDDVFVVCSMNHCIGDGTSFWNFFNIWSKIFQSQSQSCENENDVPISRLPFHDRWFLKGYSPPINPPFKHHEVYQ